LPVAAMGEERGRYARVQQSEDPGTLESMSRWEARCGLTAQQAGPDSTVRVFGAPLQPGLEPPDRLRWRSRGGARRLQLQSCAPSAAQQARLACAGRHT